MITADRIGIRLGLVAIGVAHLLVAPAMAQDNQTRRASATSRSESARRAGRSSVREYETGNGESCRKRPRPSRARRSNGE